MCWDKQHYVNFLSLFQLDLSLRPTAHALPLPPGPGPHDGISAEYAPDGVHGPVQHPGPFVIVLKERHPKQPQGRSTVPQLSEQPLGSIAYLPGGVRVGQQLPLVGTVVEVVSPDGHRYQHTTFISS